MTTSSSPPAPVAPPLATILAVDDSPVVLALLVRILTAAGYQVWPASSSESALSAIAAGPPDLILLDIRMKGADGLEVCRLIKVREETRSTPIILVSDFAETTEWMDGLKLGVVDYIIKPFHPEELLTRVKTHLTLSRAQNSLEQQAAALQRSNDLLQSEIDRRQGVEAELRRSLERAERSRRTLLSSMEDQKLAERDRKRLAVAIEAMGEVVMVTDTQGSIQYVNPAFETLTGYTRAEVIGKNPRLLKSGVQDEAFYRGLWDTLTRGRIWNGRVVNRKKDGSLYTEDATISPVHHGSGGAVSYVAVKRDISEQLRLAEEKSRLEDQLRQAQRIEAIGRLAGGVAHDFNNLTAIVLGYGEMLLGHLRQEEPARKWVEQIVSAGKRSAALTRQLLAFSRRQVLLPMVLDLNALLLNLEIMLARLLGEDILLEFKLAADLGCITADPGQIEQVIMNLALNARDAMPRGGKLDVETANVELDETYLLGHAGVVPGKYVMLSMTDIGCGMDKATLARLFEPFFTTKEKGKGTGLGLATAFGIVKQSGGYLYASSEPDKGTVFKIYLPWTDAAPTVRVVEIDEVVPRGSGERILLVEDEVSLRELCETVLTGLGYQVSAAGSGPEALLLMQEQGFEPDLVVTDVVMPGMSGVEMVDWLRRGRPDLKMIYMSGYTDDAIAPHGVLGPGTFFIPKPFTERILAAKVRDALGAKARVGCPSRRVLMIDDDEQFLELVGRFCRKRGHVFAGVDSAAAALTALAGQDFDVLLVDLNIPGTSGEDVLRKIRAAGHTAPAIVLSGDIAPAGMDALRPLGVVLALQKSSEAEPLLRAIEAVESLNDTRPRDEQQEV